ncbi:MAG: hypothetical protein ACWGOX_11335 [Desulforhopalus sp.]
MLKTKNRQTMTTPIPYRPLGLIKELLETLGFAVTHCYEDLIFMEHNAFLLQMGDKGEEVKVIFNVDCEVDKREEIGKQLSAAGKEFGLQIAVQGTYTISANEEDSTLDIEFSS